MDSGRKGNPARVDREHSAHDEAEPGHTAPEVFALVVHFRATIWKDVETEVGHHVPHGVAEEYVVKALAFIEPAGKR